MYNTLEKMASFYDQIKILIYTLFIFLNIPIDAVKILVAMLLLDTILGLIKSIKLKHKLTFKKLLWGMVSKMALLLFPMVLALMGKGLNYDLTSFPLIIMDLLIVSEGFSVIGNIQSIRTGEEVESMDIVSIIIRATREGLKKVMDKLLSALGVEKKD